MNDSLVTMMQGVPVWCWWLTAVAWLAPPMFCALLFVVAKIVDGRPGEPLSWPARLLLVFWPLALPLLAIRAIWRRKPPRGSAWLLFSPYSTPFVFRVDDVSRTRVYFASYHDGKSPDDCSYKHDLWRREIKKHEGVRLSKAEWGSWHATWRQTLDWKPPAPQPPGDLKVTMGEQCVTLPRGASATVVNEKLVVSDPDLPPYGGSRPDESKGAGVRAWKSVISDSIILVADKEQYERVEGCWEHVRTRDWPHANLIGFAGYVELSPAEALALDAERRGI